ncbi:MAG: hypothetical protein HY763_06185 [Planctomycetes bacterium]|nr:hypothetical protein [Planctomycetota bacterium]
MVRRLLSSLLALAIVATSGNGQGWLVHAHDDHAWHGHALQQPEFTPPGYGDHSSDDDHRHDAPARDCPADEGIVLVIKSGVAVGGRWDGGARTTAKAACRPIPVGVDPQTRPVAGRWALHLPPGAYGGGPSSAIASLLRTNHALLI